MEVISDLASELMNVMFYGDGEPYGKLEERYLNAHSEDYRDGWEELSNDEKWDNLDYEIWHLDSNNQPKNWF